MQLDFLTPRVERLSADGAWTTLHPGGAIGRLRTPRLARLVLLACALVVAAGLLSPTLVQGELQVVCLGNGGMKLVAISDDGQGETVSGPSMACPLCQAIAPPPVVVATPPPLLSPKGCAG